MKALLFIDPALRPGRGKPEWKRHGRRWEDNIKLDREYGVMVPTGLR